MQPLDSTKLQSVRPLSCLAQWPNLHNVSITRVVPKVVTIGLTCLPKLGLSQFMSHCRRTGNNPTMHNAALGNTSWLGPHSPLTDTNIPLLTRLCSLLNF